MLDPKLIRSDPQIVKKAMASRGSDASIVDDYLAADEIWRKKLVEFEKMKGRQNEITAKIAKLKKEGSDASALMSEMKELSQTIKDISGEVSLLEQKAASFILLIPNIPSGDTPIGGSEACNAEVRRWGGIKGFNFDVKAHDEIGQRLGLFDFKQAAKVSGARFVVLHGLGARLEMALINFMLDVHTRQNNYNQVMAPFMVNKDSMTGTGQLPKFEDELYETSDDYYLIPTAEVSVTNLHREEVIPIEKLPIKYASFSPCFRREAGSYGKDVKGIIRQHQFNKVELVKFCLPENSGDELESLTLDAEKILQLLELPYRVVLLCTGDISFSSAKTYDIEVWFPSENKYREVSSCSNFLDFQARRANIKFRRDPKSKPEFVHTLNGSGLAVGRTFAAILENYQQKDGSVVIPEALVQYMGIDCIK